MSSVTPQQTPEVRLAKQAQAFDDAGEKTLPGETVAGDPDTWAGFVEARSSLELLEQVWPQTEAAVNPGLERDGGSHSGQFGRFRIIRELGRGGFGIVFLAIDPVLNRPVALKIPRAEVLLNAAMRARFVREARAEGALDHPNIVPLYDTGVVGSICYMVSAYCQGPTLSTWLKEQTGPVPCPIAAQIVMSLADAVGHAHQRGVIHRDLKPSNVIMDVGRATSGETPLTPIAPLPTPRIADFGLARLMEWPGEEVTATFAPMGTAAYMAPEQVDGKRIGPATDLYALGAILYTLICGRSPHLGQTDVQTLHRVVYDHPTPPSRLRADVPRDLESICLKCLEKQPEKRYASAPALALDLGRFLSGQPTQARPLSLRERGRRWAQQHPAASLATVLSLLLVGSSLGVGSWYRTWLTTNRSMIRQRDVEALEWRAAEQNIRYVADIRQSARYLSNFDTRFADELLRRYLPREGETDRREFVWHHLWRRCHNEIRTLVGHQDQVYHVEYTPSGDLLASTGKEGRVLLWNTLTWQIVRNFVAHDTEVNIATFSPDGLIMATSGDDGLAKLWDVATGRLRFTLPAHPGKEGGALFAPDGRSLVTVSQEGMAKIWGTATGALQSSFHLDQDGRVMSLAISPDGTILATGGQQTITLWNLAHRTLIRILAGQQGRVLDLAFSHDGKMIAAGGEGNEAVRIFDVDNGRLLQELKGHRDGVCSVKFTRDDRMVISASQDQTIREWDLRTGAVRIVHNGHTARVWCVAVSPDGRTIASAGGDGTVKLWNPIETRVRTDLARPNRIGRIAFRPDGRSLVYVGLDGSASVWDARQGVVEESQALVRDRVCAVGLSVDGTRAAFRLCDGGIELWDLSLWRRLTRFGSLPPGYTFLVFDPSGRRLAVGIGNEKVWLLDGETGQELSVLHGDFRPLVFTPNGSALCLAGPAGWECWELATGKVTSMIIPHLESVFPFPCFSPDGSMLAIPWNEANKSTVQILESQTLKPIVALKQVPRFTGPLAISADGRDLATGEDGGVVRLWDTATGEEMLSLDSQAGQIQELRFASDGSSLAVTSWNDTGPVAIRVWQSGDRESDPVGGSGAIEPRSSR
jgi:eukaryotic-like serine/threonine-protein kinase